ncbi:hypothetical protein AUK11_03120 [bacterium CG2_30_37_16]|nr:MAG: hypothetical protein AUK11_03120 [bacterium CG2_30_37_16]PIP30219.1 MAG: hypothetical protein COX25_05710 [bacterium (Candidatus Howlettbacteria) CG23_combo_of_CG06-09_8_20_14_all_37_9]PIY00193.1 MAG: hypothetical protein COZ22_00835 [bacterium (Candidatus Howlettbacteria) CG_4_10_14_3_um_filter_37_10]PJB07251.1 MAG: hypothetical protein CO123_00655 [bacterium (Candidatus Howlettbacteria) CG_4_9_14_3_um_filter_37_10]
MTPTLRNILVPVLVIIAFVGIALGIANYRKQATQNKENEEVVQMAPEINLTSPQDQEKISSSDVTVKGTTDPENKITINLKDVMVGNDGFFETTVPLDKPENRVIVEATDKNGNKTSVERVVIKEGATTVTTETGKLSQAGPETTIIFAFGAIFVAYLARRFTFRSIATSLKKY